LLVPVKVLKKKIQGNTDGLGRGKGLGRGGCARTRERATERGRMLARGGTGQNTVQAMRLGAGKHGALTRMVLWLQQTARADFLNNLLQVALGPAKI